jgi:hypothetical protein
MDLGLERPETKTPSNNILLTKMNGKLLNCKIKIPGKWLFVDVIGA